MSNFITPTGIEAKVCEDITMRQRLGIAKYGVTVANNPLSLYTWLHHAYEETLDQAIYLRRAMAEIEKHNVEADALKREIAMFVNIRIATHWPGGSQNPTIKELIAMIDEKIKVM